MSQDPQNIPAEQAALGAILRYPDLIHEIDTEIAAFYYKKHQWIYQAMRDLGAQQRPIDILTLSEDLNRKGQLDQIGGMAYLAQLSDISTVPTIAHIQEYAKMIEQAWLQREAIHIASDLAGAARSGNGTLTAALKAAQIRTSELLPQPERAEPEEADVPPLPADVEIDSALAADAGPWIDEYVAYAMNVSPMTPIEFHESAALWLVSSAVARRVVLPMAFDKIYPNLWVAWVAPSTLFGKSTSMNLARRIALQTYRHLLCAEDMTPEGLILDMAGNEPSNLTQMTIEDQSDWTKRRDFAAQRAWTMDEFSGLLATAGRDYNAGLLETLMRFYDCTEKYTRMTAGRGMQTINNSYLTLLAASTPTALAQHLTNERLWGMGFWPRFALLAPENNRPAWAEPEEQPPPDLLIARIREIFQRLPDATWPDPPPDITAQLVGDAFPLWNRYNKALRFDLLDDSLDHRLWAAYGRLPVTALKVSTLLAVLDWPDNDAVPRIHARHIMRAMEITERWRRSAHNVLSLAMNEADNKLEQRIIQKISANPGGMTHRDLYKNMKRTKPKTIERILNDLVMQGEVQEIEYQNPKGGPKTKKYVVG